MSSFHHAQKLTYHWCFKAVVALYLSLSTKISWGMELALVARQCSDSSMHTHHQFVYQNLHFIGQPFVIFADQAPCDFYLFGKFNLPMKGMRYPDVPDVQQACINILRAMPVNDLKSSFEMVSTCANHYMRLLRQPVYYTLWGALRR